MEGLIGLQGLKPRRFVDSYVAAEAATYKARFVPLRAGVSCLVCGAGGQEISKLEISDFK